MSRQQRWRNATNLKRLEVYLPPETVARLDELVEESGTSRAKVIAELVEQSVNRGSRA